MAHAITTTGLLRSRDLFVHDGNTLRRIRLSSTVQLMCLAVAAVMLAWSAYAVAHFISGEKLAPVVVSDAQKMQQLAAAAEERAKAIEQRQQLLATMMSGGEVDPAALPEVSDARYKQAAKELSKLGLTPQRLAVGGPFEPTTKADPTFKALFNSWKKLDSLQDGVIAVPSDVPVRNASFTSSFGVRSDPFGRGAAMHAGIDLAGPVGTPIYATADGTVSQASWHNGGYGNLVRLDHGRGIETRYGHLSSMTVRPGERVRRGQLIGRMGSTGRSTGSHLHYEVRIDGRAVNPVPFMRSTDIILAIRDRAGNRSMDQVAQGGPSKQTARR
jgi:murein DD-endopeptidase MepM/ murein hydrolase activator NlpD